MRETTWLASPPLEFASAVTLDLEHWGGERLACIHRTGSSKLEAKLNHAYFKVSVNMTADGLLLFFRDRLMGKLEKNFVLKKIPPTSVLLCCQRVTFGKDILRMAIFGRKREKGGQLVTSWTSTKVEQTSYIIWTESGLETNSGQKLGDPHWQPAPPFPALGNSNIARPPSDKLKQDLRRDNNIVCVMLFIRVRERAIVLLNY